ncbi:MAG: inositol monophosphatase [Actinomycetota bacterium]
MDDATEATQREGRPPDERELTTELDAAQEFATLGSRVALGHFRRDPAVKRKPDGTFATEADWAAEAQIRLRIARAFPDHNVLGEEEGLTAAGGGAARPGAPTWIVDPIDGTNNFIAGIPVWATLVALAFDDEPVVGVCDAPAIDENYDGASGMGARFNGKPISVAPAGSLSDAMVCLPGAESFMSSGLGGFFDALVGACGRSRGFADFWGHMLVARGAAHVMVEPHLNLWDIAALQPIVTEAGGRVTHLDGKRWIDRGSCLTTNTALHDEVLALARDTV